MRFGPVLGGMRRRMTACSSARRRASPCTGVPWLSCRVLWVDGRPLCLGRVWFGRASCELPAVLFQLSTCPTRLGPLGSQCGDCLGGSAPALCCATVWFH